MAVETEAKIKVDAHEGLRARLHAVGAERHGAVLETNWIFDDAQRSLLATGRGLRVRDHQTLNGPDRPPTLTYKGAVRPGSLKTRDEVELTISDASAARSLLAALGFVVSLSFEKRRESWALGRCHVELDEVPYLGCYVEVEGADDQAVREVVDRLGLADRPVITESYVALLVEHARQHGLSVDRIAFPPGDRGGTVQAKEG